MCQTLRLPNAEVEVTAGEAALTVAAEAVFTEAAVVDSAEAVAAGAPHLAEAAGRTVDRLAVERTAAAGHIAAEDSLRARMEGTHHAALELAVDLFRA